MAGKYLIDTNIAIYYLNNQLPAAIANELDKETLSISVITRMELLAWRNASVEELAMLEAFIKNTILYNLEEPVILKSIEIRKLHSIKLPDAIIAATALVNNYTLVTRNTADFKNIEGLKMTNPW
ncbi:type II toxin-antitoxin system VapC family toxin [Niabella drilacis]|nr:type II toxin-antitoxin system VapC family toxin [Niabella drilacis]